MEYDIHFFEATIDWTYKDIIGVNRVSCVAADYNEFITKIKLFYAFADNYTVSSIKHIIHLAYEEKYIKGERAL